MMMKLAVLFAALLVAGPACAGTDALPDPELCTDYAATLLMGHSLRTGMFHVYSQAELAQAIKARGLSCEPMEQYFQIARYRLERADENNAAYQQREQAQQQYYQQRREQRQQQLQKRPVQTTCTQMGVYTNCTTTGG